MGGNVVERSALSQRSQRVVQNHALKSWPGSVRPVSCRQYRRGRSLPAVSRIAGTGSPQRRPAVQAVHGRGAPGEQNVDDAG